MSTFDGAPAPQHPAGATTLPGFPPGAALKEQPWYTWHAPYDEIRSVQTDRLGAVQEIISTVLDAAPPHRLKAVSICSGQARDLLPVLISHPRGHDLAVRMIELEPLNASFLYGAIGSTDLQDVEVIVADAGSTDAYLGAVPADMLLISGPFASIGQDDTLRTVRMLPRLCAPGAVVVWSTYGAGLAALDPLLKALGAAGFTELSLVKPGSLSRTQPVSVTATGDPDLDGELFEGGEFAAGAHRFDGEPLKLLMGERMFTY
ncbi:hypothetical protein [Actinomadura rugatobispora]|uniref:SAM-dependent methyltransferase n=1 Tax=Actinomadura rugatobispora TaxID=1994 RepID=A0ABW1A7X7_9ACTN|nr:hypothetical protein GCM10010200_032700 [Actinomadura rugatobispora]